MATNKYSKSKSETGKNYNLKKANSLFGRLKYIDADTNEGGGYHIRQYPDGTIQKFNGHTGEYESFNTPEDQDYAENRMKYLLEHQGNEYNILGRMIPALRNTKIGTFEKGGDTDTMETENDITQKIISLV